MAGKVRNALSMSSGGNSGPAFLAFQSMDKRTTGQKGNTPKVSRVSSTARVSGSGQAG